MEEGSCVRNEYKKMGERGKVLDRREGELEYYD